MVAHLQHPFSLPSEHYKMVKVAQSGTSSKPPAAGMKQNENRILSICNFLSKGWEVSVLGLLVFIRQEYSLPLYMVGILSTVFIASQIGVSLFAGRIAHAVRSRNVVLLAIGASGLSWLTLFLAHHSALLCIAYALGGVSSGLFEPIGNSLIAKGSSANKRGTAIGNFAAFGDMGRIAVGAMATALAGWVGVNNACGVLLLTNAAALVLSLVYLEEPSPDGDAETHESPVRLR